MAFVEHPLCAWCFVVIIVFAQVLNGVITISSVFQMRVMGLREVRAFT